MKTLSNIFYYLLITAICCVGLLVLASLMPIKGNFSIKVVKSGSMEPVMPVGSVVVDMPQSEYHLGDVITFGADTKTQIPTTHRIVGISGTGDSEMFTTKGDANNAPDQTTTSVKDVHGEVLFIIPYLGYLLAFAKTKLGFILLVAIPAGLICIEEIYKIFLEVRRLRRDKKATTTIDKRINPFATERAELPERRFVMDLRSVRRVTAAKPSKKSSRPSHATQAIIASLSIVFVVTWTSLSHTSGDTAALYANSQASIGNKMQRGEDTTVTTTDSLFIFAGKQGMIVGPDTPEDTGTSTSDISTVDATSTSDTVPPTDPPAAPDASPSSVIDEGTTEVAPSIDVPSTDTDQSATPSEDQSPADPVPADSAPSDPPPIE